MEARSNAQPAGPKHRAGNNVIDSEDSPTATVIPSLPATDTMLDMEAQRRHSFTIVDSRTRHSNLTVLLQAVQRFRPSPIMIYLFATISSLSLAIWWTVSHNDISGGFTMGAYVWGVIIFPTGYWHWTMSKTGTTRTD